MTPSELKIVQPLQRLFPSSDNVVSVSELSVSNKTVLDFCSLVCKFPSDMRNWDVHERMTNFKSALKIEPDYDDQQCHTLKVRSSFSFKKTILSIHASIGVGGNGLSVCPTAGCDCVSHLSHVFGSCS